jgi:hypothetical protein
VIKLFSILTSCLILIQSLNIDFKDIVQLDELIAHSKFHSETYGDNFFSFIDKHYGELKQEHSIKHHEEKKEHEQLPFDHQSCVHTSVASILIQANIHLLKNEPIIANNFYYQELYSLFEKTSVFQPPKYA